MSTLGYCYYVNIFVKQNISLVNYFHATFIRYDMEPLVNSRSCLFSLFKIPTQRGSIKSS